MAYNPIAETHLGPYAQVRIEDWDMEIAEYDPYTAGRCALVVRQSLDDGRTWSKPQVTGLHAPESCPCIATVPGTDAQIVVWNNSEYDMEWCSHYGKRTPLTLAISRDGLRTFEHFFDIETDPNRAFTNPSITVTSDGLFLLNYWTSPYSSDGHFGGLIDLKLATFRIHL
jgi:hypothetical protein